MAKNYESLKNSNAPETDFIKELSELHQEVGSGEKLSSKNANINGVDKLSDKITKQEETEYLKLNNKYKSLLKMAADYSLSVAQENEFKKRGLSFAINYNNKTLEIHSESWKSYALSRFRIRKIRKVGKGPYVSDSDERKEVIRPNLFGNGGEINEDLSIKQYKKVLDQVEEILMNQKDFLWKEQQKQNKKIDETIDNL